MEIRYTKVEEVPEVMAIYAHARQYMAENGNPKQWGATNWPPESLIRQDIEAHKSYVCVQDGAICAVFFFDQGEDVEPCYREIDGAWIGKGPYGVVHRIAASGNVKGAGKFCIAWAHQQCGDLRMDTHGDNKIMQHILLSLGFQPCGIIHVVEDNDPRLAYEWL